MKNQETLFKYLLQLGDNAMILGHRLSEWCGHGPILEQDIAITNIALDLFGQARAWLEYASKIEGKGRNEDDLAYLREPREFTNVLLVEQPNEDWAYTIIRQFLFDAFHYSLQKALTKSPDKQIAAIAAKSLKEVSYHLRYSSEWTIRLGDGTEVSRQKMQTALNDLWTYSGELYTPNAIETQMLETGIGANLEEIKNQYLQRVTNIFEQATLTIPNTKWMQSGGKEGNHSEHFGHILSEFQFMQRAYPGLEW